MMCAVERRECFAPHAIVGAALAGHLWRTDRPRNPDPARVNVREPTTAYSEALLVEQARDLFFAANGFSVADYAAAEFTIGVWGWSLKFPNVEERKRVVPFHDLHHVLTGYGTDWMGEAEIGAWELRAGCNSWVAYFLNASGVALGLFLSPARVWRAFLAAKGQHTLYRDPVPYPSLLQMSVGEVRRRLGIPPHGLVP